MGYFWRTCFLFALTTGFALHYAQVKSPGQFREVASWSQGPMPIYDASFKL